MKSVGKVLADYRAEKRKQNDEMLKKKREVFSSNLTKKLRQDYHDLQNEVEKLKMELQTIKEGSSNPDDVILNDLLLHSQSKNEQYSPELLSLAMEIQTIAPKAYSKLVKRLHFPNEKVINRTIEEIVGDLPGSLTNIENAGTLIDMFRSRNNINKSQNVDVCLAVDALTFTPDVQIKPNGEIIGMNDQAAKRSISKKCHSVFANDTSEFEKFLKLNSDQLIKAGFVFQIQPYNIMLKPFVIHVHPTVNGKSNDKIVSLLHQIRKIAKNRNITVKSFAFDGDNAYSELHKIYYESYIHKAIKEHTISFDRTRTIRVVSDYLHIIKRLRYRLLSCILHCGFDLNDVSIELESIKKILNQLPNIVWNNEPYTKMHDKLYKDAR